MTQVNGHQVDWSPRPGAHYLPTTVSSQVPRRVVYLDTETVNHRVVDGQELTWRLGVTASALYHSDSKRWSHYKFKTHHTPEDLWQTVIAHTLPGCRTLAVAHNLSFDLRISRGLEILTDWGWRVSKISVSHNHVSATMTKNRRVLILVDSVMVLIKGIRELGDIIGLPKLDMPGEDASWYDWETYCKRDVTILAICYQTVLDWLRQEDMGCWARTGAGIGWNNLQRRHLHHKVLVHADNRLRQLEIEAAYSGRAEAWRHGQLRDGPWYEWDYEMAYGNICHDEVLPSVYRGHLLKPRVPSLLGHMDSRAYLVRAQVHTDVPTLPWRDHLGICWPVGDFTGWWWLPELQLAMNNGADVLLHEAHEYTASPWLKDWAQWCIQTVHDKSTPQAQIRGLVAKHWQRAVPGRSSMKFMPWEPVGDSHQTGLGYSQVVNYQTGQVGQQMEIGGQLWQAWDAYWWDQAIPQLLSAVMSYTRIRIWRAMQTAGLENLAMSSTDCVIVYPRGHENLKCATDKGSLTGLRVKGVHDRLTVWAPLFADGSTYRRLAGVPHGAVRVKEDEWAGERWDSFATTLEHGTEGVIRTHDAKFSRVVEDVRRHHLPDGLTASVVVRDNKRFTA